MSIRSRKTFVSCSMACAISIAPRPATNDRARSRVICAMKPDKLSAAYRAICGGRSTHIDALWVDDNYRRQGYGAKLMKAIEDYAAAHGHPLVYLETASFQALPFYQSLGYVVFGELEEISPGHTLFFLRKELRRDRVLMSGAP